MKEQHFTVEKEEVMFKVGDKVRFKDEDQEGVGVIVVRDYDRTPYLVYSEDIVGGHQGSLVGVNKQDNYNNWWFSEHHLTLVDGEDNSDWLDSFLKREFEIKISTKEERDAVLAILEKEGLKWQSGHKATGFKPESFPYYIATMKSGLLGYGRSSDLGHKVDGVEFIKHLSTKEESITPQDCGEHDDSYVTTDELIKHLKDYMGSGKFDIEPDTNTIKTPTVDIFTDRQVIKFCQDSSFDSKGVEHLGIILAYLATPVAAREDSPVAEEDIDFVSELKKDIDELFGEGLFIGDIRERLLDLIDEYED